MARCGCSGTSCSCVIRGTGAIQVTGAGTVNAPYVVDGRLYLESGSGVTLGGSGSAGDPYVIDFDNSLSIHDLEDVNTSGSTGYVLARQADGSFALAPPSTAAVGSVSSNNSLSGDGSSGSPLAVRLASGGGLTLTTGGLAVASQSTWTAYTPQITTASGTLVPDAGTSLEGRYMKMGRTVFVQISLLASLSIPRPSGYYSISLPFQSRNNAAGFQMLDAAMIVDAYTGRIMMGYGSIEGNEVARIRLDDDGTTKNVGSTWPNWGSYAMKMVLQGFYESTT